MSLQPPIDEHDHVAGPFDAPVRARHVRRLPVPVLHGRAVDRAARARAPGRAPAVRLPPPAADRGPPGRRARRRGRRGRVAAGLVLGDARRAVRQRRATSPTTTCSRSPTGSGSTRSASAPTLRSGAPAARVARDAERRARRTASPRRPRSSSTASGTRKPSTPVRWSRHSRPIRPTPTNLAPPWPGSLRCSLLSSPCSSPLAAGATTPTTPKDPVRNVPDEAGVREKIKVAVTPDETEFPRRRRQDARGAGEHDGRRPVARRWRRSIFTTGGDEPDGVRRDRQRTASPSTARPRSTSRRRRAIRPRARSSRPPTSC